MADTQQGAPQNRGKKRPKSYYVRAKEGKRIRRDAMLTVGMRGVLLTCNHGVKPCVKEAYNLLAEYADQLYGPEKDSDEEQSPASEDEDGRDSIKCKNGMKVGAIVVYEIHLWWTCILFIHHEPDHKVVLVQYTSAF